MNTRRPAIRPGTQRFSSAAVAARFVRGWGNLVTGLATGEKPLVRQVMGEARTLRVSPRVPIPDLEERAVPREICGLQVPERPLRASRKWLPAGRAQVVGACFAGLPGNPSKQLSIPGLCPSCARADPRLPPPCACVYSSPSRRTPVSAAARTPRTGYCGRRRRSDRPFRTGFSRWLGRKRRLSPKPPSFKSSLNPFISTLKSLFGRRVRSWLRTNAGGAPNTCKSRG